MSETKEATMQINSREFACWCYDHAVRIGAIISVSAGHDGEDATGALEDAIDNRTDKQLAELFGKGILRHIKPEPGDKPSERERRGAVLSYLNDSDSWGFIVNMERAVRKYRADGTCTYSWGHFNTKDIYADALDAALIDRIEKWDAELDARQRAEPKAKAAAV